MKKLFLALSLILIPVAVSPVEFFNSDDFLDAPSHESYLTNMVVKIVCAYGLGKGLSFIVPHIYGADRTDEFHRDIANLRKHNPYASSAASIGISGASSFLDAWSDQKLSEATHSRYPYAALYQKWVQDKSVPVSYDTLAKGAALKVVSVAGGLIASDLAPTVGQLVPASQDWSLTANVRGANGIDAADLVWYQRGGKSTLDFAGKLPSYLFSQIGSQVGMRLFALKARRDFLRSLSPEERAAILEIEAMNPEERAAFEAFIRVRQAAETA